MRDVIGEVEARDVPEIVVFTKADLVDSDRRLELQGLASDGLFVSAHTGEGIDLLLARIAELLPTPEVTIDVLVPFERGDLVSYLHERGAVLELDHEETGTRLKARVHPDQLGLFEAFTVAS